MISPNIKKFNNEISFYEKKSSKIVPPDCYYIVHISLKGGEQSMRINLIPKISESLLLSEPSPKSIYHTNSSIILIFPSQIQEFSTPISNKNSPKGNCLSPTHTGNNSPSESNNDNHYLQQHQLEGLHHKIISKYVHSLTLETLECGCNIEAKIINFQVPNHILGYIYKISMENTNEEYVRVSKGVLTTDDISKLTEIEIKDILRNKCEVIWDNINSNDRFGTMIKLKNAKRGEPIKRISEHLDYREHKRYTKFIID